jgi:hypothetical protein
MAVGARKPSLVTSGVDPKFARVLEPIKQTLGMITGAQKGVGELKGFAEPKSVTTEMLARKINEIIARINASGNY